MPDDRLTGPRLKIERADEHIHELEVAIKRFHESKPYEVVRDVIPDTGKLQYRLNVLAFPPPRLALIAGDAIHNLRSALDLLWCQLVEGSGKDIVQSDFFIVSDDRNKFEAAFKGAKKRIVTPARPVIAGLKPYKGGHDGLWRLHKLDVIDKHRLLLAVWTSSEAVVLRFKLQPPWTDEPIITPPIGIRPADRRLEDGALLYTGPTATEAPQIHEEPEFRIGIALDEPPIVECEPIIPLLTQLRGAVDQVIVLLAPTLTE